MRMSRVKFTRILTCVFICVLASQPSLGAYQCVEIFAKQNEMMDMSGFRNPYDVISEDHGNSLTIIGGHGVEIVNMNSGTVQSFGPQKELSQGGQRKLNPVRRVRVRHFIASDAAIDRYIARAEPLELRDTKQWLVDFKNKDPEAIEILNVIATYGSNKVVLDTVPIEYLKIIRDLHEYGLSEMPSLSSKQLSLLYAMFAHWQVLPSKKFQGRWNYAVTESIADFTKYDFYVMSHARGKTPWKGSGRFESAYKKALIDLTPEMKPHYAVNIWSAEFLRGTFLSLKELTVVVERLRSALSIEQIEKIRIVAAKQLIRGLHRLRSENPGVLSEQLTSLQVMANEVVRQKLGVERVNGTSGITSPITMETWVFKKDMKALQKKYPDSKVEKEVMFEDRYGFFDPADALLHGPRIVYESDGSQHYYKQLKDDGSIVFQPSRSVLRMQDQARDVARAHEGYTVLRVAKGQNIFDVMREAGLE